MVTNKNIFKKMLINPAMMYICTRYVIYIVQFVNSVFIAVYLGPFYLGIWGFIQMIIQYFGQLHFGIPQAVNVILSIERKDKDYSREIVGNAIVILFLVSVLAILFFFINIFFNINIGEKYNFDKFVIPVCLIGVLGYYNLLFSKLFRVYGKIMAVAINQSLFPVLVLFFIFFFKGEMLLWVLVFANLCSVIISFLIYLIYKPLPLKLSFDYKVTCVIFKKGWYLFMNDSCFYLIMLSTRSFVSAYYSIEDFGFFTFTYSLAHAILLFLETVSFLIFPKLINRFAAYDNLHINKIIENLRNVYIVCAHALMHIIIMIFPFFLYLFPVYETTFSVFALTAFTVALYTNGFGYSELLLARGNEKKLGCSSFLALVLNIIFAFSFVVGLKVTYEYVVFSTMLSYFVFVLLLGMFARKSLSINFSLVNILKDVFPLRIMLPFVLSITLIILKKPHLFFLLSFVLFFVLNFKYLFQIKDVVKQIINSPKIINI